MVFPLFFLRKTTFATSYNTELNDLRKIICLKKSEVSVERISVCNVTENLAEHGMHFLPCSYTNDDINVTVTTMASY